MMPRYEPEEEWTDEEEELAVFYGDELPCPSCGRMIYEEAEQCPYCGDWVMPLEAASRQRNWVWWTAIVGVLIMVVLILKC